MTSRQTWAEIETSKGEHDMLTSASLMGKLSVFFGHLLATRLLAAEDLCSNNDFSSSCLALL